MAVTVLDPATALKLEMNTTHGLILSESLHGDCIKAHAEEDEMHAGWIEPHR